MSREGQATIIAVIFAGLALGVFANIAHEWRAEQALSVSATPAPRDSGWHGPGADGGPRSTP